MCGRVENQPRRARREAKYFHGPGHFFRLGQPWLANVFESIAQLVGLARSLLLLILNS